MQAQFLLDPAMAQFAAFVLSPHTHVLEAAIERLPRRARPRHRGGAARRDRARGRGARRRRRRTTAADAGQYALTDSTTMGLGLMYGGLALAPGDEVLTTTHDFYSTEESLRLLRRRTGATVSRVTLYDDPAAADVDEMVGRLAAGITPRTKVVALTWVHSGTGVRVPVAEICAALEALSRVPRSQYVVCVDGVHGFSRRGRRTCRTWAATSSRPARTSGCSARAAPGSSGAADWASADRGDPDVLRPAGPGRPAHAGRLPLLRAPLGAGRRVRVHGRHRPGPAGRADRRAGHAAQGGRSRDVPGITLKTPMSPDVSAGIVCFDGRRSGAARRGVPAPGVRAWSAARRRTRRRTSGSGRASRPTRTRSTLAVEAVSSLV